MPPADPGTGGNAGSGAGGTTSGDRPGSSIGKGGAAGTGGSAGASGSGGRGGGTAGASGSGGAAGSSGAAGVGGAGGASGSGPAGAGGGGPAGSAGTGSTGTPDAGGGNGATDGGGPRGRDAGTDVGAGGADGGTGAKAWRPFNDTSPWNTPIAANAKVAADSAALIADFATSSQWPFFTINIETYSIPVYYVDSNTPLTTVKATTVGGQGFDTGSARVPVPAGAAPAAGTDAHLCIVDRQTNQEWGMWAASNSASGWTCEVCATADLTGAGTRPPTKDPPWWMGHGARACGFPLIAGLITVDEMRAGSIEHALVIAYPHIRSRYYTSPASTAQPTTNEALPTRGVPCGGRMQLDPTLDIEQMGLSPSGKIIARALQKYGAIVGDFSGAMSLYADSSPTAQAVWKSGLLTTYEIKDQIDLSKFRVLEWGALYDNAN